MSPAKTLPQPSPFFMLPPATYLDIPQYQSVNHYNIPWPSFSSLATMDKIYPSFGLMNVENLCIDYEVIVETNGGYASSINGKVKRPQETIDNTICIQLLSCWYSDKLWCFCYKYTIWIISCLINRCLGKYTIFSWYKHKKISYTIKFIDLLIWR